jgi:hypothetical protein
MAARLFGIAAAVAVVVFTAACGDDSPPSAPQDGLSLKVTPPPTFPCAFTGNPSLGNAINGYFTSSADRKTASDLATVMQTAFATAPTPNYTAAQPSGFDLLSFVGKTSRTSGAGSSPGAGAVVVQQALQCMFDISLNEGGDFNGWATDDPHWDFATALTPSVGGALYVRGGLAPHKDSTDAVVANDPNRGSGTAGNISVMAPQTGGSWDGSLHNPSNRVLIYGEPTIDGNSAPDGYDWKLVPRGTTFDPAIVVELCPAANTIDGNSADMVFQANVGVLGFATEDFCGTSASLASAGKSGGALALLRQMTRSAGAFFAPEPLQAAVALSGTGSLVSGAKGDKFSIKNVPAVQLIMTIENLKPRVKVNTGDLGTITVKVQTPLPAPQSPVGGVTVTLSAVNNNGFTRVGEIVSGACVAPVAPKTTLATIGQDGTTAETTVFWNHGCITKTGIVSVVANSKAQGRSGGIGTTSSAKFNVIP